MSDYKHLIFMNELPIFVDAYLHPINLIPTLILELLLIYDFELPWACPTISDYNYLIFINQSLVLWMPTHIQKINLIPMVILHIMLIYGFDIL